ELLVRAEKGEADAKAQLDRARRTLMTNQLSRVAAILDRDPLAGRELLDDTNACPLDLRDFSWGFYYRLCKRERLTLVGHGSGVFALALTADGSTLASGGVDSTVRIWEVASGRTTATLRGHSGPVAAVAFSPDGKTLASGSQDSRVILWNAA